MSRDKIGIEVQVQFPTVKELQEQLAHKWRSVKNGFEGKINVSVDGNSLKQLKTQIQSALNKSVFDIKIDPKQAIKGIDKIQGEIRKLDTQLGKTREVKINFKSTDLDKTLKDLLDSSKAVDKVVESQNREHKRTNDELNKQLSTTTKIQRIQKQMSDGTWRVTNKHTEDINSGLKRTVTNNPNGTQTINTVKDIAGQQKMYEKLWGEADEKRKKELKEIEDILKRIHRIELDQVDAEGESFRILERERKLQQEQLGLLSEQYNQKHRMNSLKDNTIKELKKQQEVNLELKMTANLKKAQREEDKEISKIISRVIQLEKEKQKLAKQSQSATDAELKSLKTIYDSHSNTQRKMMEKYNIQEKMTAEQRKEWENVKRIGYLETELVREKQEKLKLDKETARAVKEQQEATRILENEIRDIHKIKLEILRIEERLKHETSNITNAEREKLAILENEKQYAEEQYRRTRQVLEAEGKITDEVKQQLKLQNDVYKRETERVRNASRIKSEQDDINRKLSEYDRLSRGISQLQRDLIYAGMREQTVIERQIVYLQDKQRKLKQELDTTNAITKARRREIDEVKKIQKEQLELNRLRQDAREKDRSFDDTGGLVDPHSYFMHLERGAMSVFEPVQRLDEALVGITKVANATDEAFADFAKSSYDVGSGLGVTADEYMVAVEKWVTAGKTFNEAQELAQTSMIGAFVGNIEPDMMVKYMSVPLNAYKKAGLEANDIINIMNETSNNNAVEMTELGKAYMRSAQSAKNAGVGFTELTGLVTGAVEATRMSGERVGTALKTISINYNNIKGQITGHEQKKFDMLKEYGIDLEQTDTVLEAIEKVASLRDKLTDVEMNEILYRMAGKEHQNVLMGIVDEWDTVKDVIASSEAELGLGEFGSAYVEHNKQADSVKFKLAELKNAWDELMFTVGGGQDGVTKIMDILIRGLEELNDMAKNDKLMDMLKLLLTGIGLHATTNLAKRLFDTLITGASGYMNTMRLAGDFVKNKGQQRQIRKQSQATDSDNDSSGKNNSNTKGSTAVVPLSGKSSAGKDKKELDKANESAKKTDKTVGMLGRGLGRALSFIPLLGDALLILEFAGVPVFDKIGGFISKATTNNEELIKSLEKSTEKFKLENEIINGSMDKNIKKSEELESAFRNALGEGNEDKNFYDLKGVLDDEEFIAFKEQFNVFAEELGLEIEITMNDTDHIREKIAELKRELNALDASETKSLGDKLLENYSVVTDEQEKYQSNLEKEAELKEKIAEIEGRISDHRKNGNVGTDMYFSDTQELSRLKSDLEDVHAEMEGHDERVQAYTNSVKDLSVAILEQGGSLNTLEIDIDDATQLLTPMREEFGNLAENLKESTDAYDKFRDTDKLTSKQWRETMEQFPELSDEIKSKNYEMINSNEDLRDSINKAIEDIIKKDEQSLISASEALVMMARRAGMEQEVQEEILKTGSISEETLGKIAKKIGELPETYTTKILMEGTITTQAGTIWDRFGMFKDNPNLNNKVSMEGSQSKDFQNAYNRYNWLFGQSNPLKKTVSINASYNDPRGLLTGGVKDGSVSTAVDVDSNPVGGVGLGAVTSQSVSSTGAISSPTVASIDRATSSKSRSTKSNSRDTKPKPNNSRVNSDVWRYWKTEMRIDVISKSIEDLTRTMKNANDNEQKLIKLYQQQNKELQKQRSSYTTLRKQQQSEMSSTLKSLRSYGFKTKGNDITNLGHSKSLKGTRAEKAEELLNTWKRLTSDMAGVTKSIADLNQTIKDNNQAIREAKISQEAKKFEKQSKRIDSLLQTVSNSDDMFSQKLKFVSESDAELGLRETEKAMNASIRNSKLLIKEFNKLSTAKISYKENAETLQGQLDSLGKAILAQADAVVEYQQSLNDLEINRVIDDFNKFNDAVDENTSKISNNISNLKDGLLSGTSIKDLQSAMSSELDFGRNNKYNERARERIALEQQVQQALDAFARKNVEREKNVSNTILKIKETMYNDLLKMQKAYSNGQAQTFTKINDTLKSHQGTAVDSSYKFTNKLDKYFNAVQDKQEKLTDKYHKDVAKSLSLEEEDKITNKYIVDNLKLQEEYFKSLINASKDAISEYKKQLKDPALTDEQVNQINTQIKEYEKTIVDAQNNIKDSVRERFDFELSLLEEVFSKYDEYANQLDYAMSVLDAIGGRNNASVGVIYREMLSAERSRNAELANAINSLEKQRNLYKEGSFEWKIINDEVEEYRDLLKDSNIQIMEMNKNIMSNSFSQTIDRIEKTLFNGKTLDKLRKHQELWMEGLEREIALEDAYQRLSELSSKAYDEKMAELSKREKISKFEMDYLNKQIDILELQEKMNNLSRERTVQVLKQQADGTWDWSYDVNASELADVESELRQAELELQQQEQQAQEDYLSRLQNILEDAQAGNFDSIKEFEDAISSLGEAFETVLVNFPQIQNGYIDELIQAYSHYIIESQNAINDIRQPLVSDKKFDEFSSDIVKVFDEISKNIGDSIANVLLDKVMPRFGVPLSNKVTDKAVSINLEKVEFPNVTNPDGIKEAIMSLPQIALQKSKEKM